MSVKNSVYLIGNVGKDLELKHTDQGTAYCHMNVAVNKRYKDKDGETKTITNWFNMTLWAKKAESLSRFIKKGALVAVSGELVTKSREGEDGKRTYSMEIKVDDVELLGGKREGGAGGGDNEDPDNIDSYPSGDNE